MSTILLVDDEVDSLWLFKLVLEERGYHVIVAEDGNAALAKASRCLPDLIVTDWNMPGTDGVELCQRLKCYPALAQIPVVMSSGQTPVGSSPSSTRPEMPCSSMTNGSATNPNWSKWPPM